MTTRVVQLAILAAVLVMAAPALAQRGGGPGGQQLGETGGAPAQSAPVGAGTTTESTTGQSGAKSGAGSGGVPPPPQRSLCDPNQGSAHEYCLYVVLEGAQPPEPEGSP
jgi:hypothetical protein